MNLIIGGAYQGKLAYAQQQYQLKPEDILDCDLLSSDHFPLSLDARCIYHYETYIELCMTHDIPIQTQFRADQIVIADDIFCGVVPIDPHLRLWRETCGRALTQLALSADTVTRVFCGLPLKVKGGQ